MYILCKANEVFMVGVDVRNLDINQQQHLLGETADQKKIKKVGEVEEWDWEKRRKRHLRFSPYSLNISYIIVRAKVF